MKRALAVHLVIAVVVARSLSAQTVVNSVFTPSNMRPINYSDARNWTPQEVPNNSAEKEFRVYISPAVGLDIDATISWLLLSANFQAEDRSFHVAGPTMMLGGGIHIASREQRGATFRTQSLDWASDGRLLGRYSIANNAAGAGWATLQVDNANITELRNAHLTLRGPMTRFIDGAGNDALRHLRLIDSDSELVMVGRQFSTPGPLSVEGMLSISSGYNHPVLFGITGPLTNYDATTRTLSGGKFYVGSSAYSGADAPAVLRFPGADIVNNATTVSLFGPFSKITDELGRDALRNLARNSTTGSLRFADVDFTTADDFTNEGTLELGGGKFLVSGRLTNYDPATKTLSGGRFTIAGERIPAELRFTGADIVRNAADLSITSNGSITDESGANALRNLAYNEPGGMLAGSFNPSGDFTNAGRVLMTAFTMPAGHVYLQTSGETNVGPGQFTGTMQIKGGVITGTAAEATPAAVIGSLTVSKGTLAIGQLSVKGSVTLGAEARVAVDIPAPGTITLSGPPGLTVDGPVSLAGMIEFDDPGDFPPPSNAFFPAIQSTALSGSFANAPAGTRVPTKNGRGSYVVIYQNNSVLIGAYQRAEPAAQLLNISTRAKVRTGQDVTIGGFIVYGFGQKKVALRGIGPSLTSSSVAGALRDPAIELHDSAGHVVAQNDNWRDGQPEEINQANLAPADDREAALVATLPRGAYTVVLRDASDSDGIGLVEVYDLAQDSGSKLANISTRGFVDGSSPLIGGLIAGGSGKGKAELTVRAIGPSLADQKVIGYLPDPALQVRDSNGGLIAENDDWGGFPDGNFETIEPSLYPRHDQDSATGLVIPPGHYTVVVRGSSVATSGIAVVEVYDLNR